MDEDPIGDDGALSDIDAMPSTPKSPESAADDAEFDLSGRLDMLQKDAYVLFRALCRLSTKPLPEVARELCPAVLELM